MCSPKVNFSKQELKSIKRFKDIKLNEIIIPDSSLLISSIGARKNENFIPKFLQKTEYPSVNVVIHKGVLTYFAQVILPKKEIVLKKKKKGEIVNSKEFVQEIYSNFSANAYELAKWADITLIKKGLEPINGVIKKP